MYLKVVNQRNEILKTRDNEKVVEPNQKTKNNNKKNNNNLGESAFWGVGATSSSLFVGNPNSTTFLEREVTL